MEEGVVAPMRRGLLSRLIPLLLALAATPVFSRTYRVCPTGAFTLRCQFKGDAGIQAAIDRAANGDSILIEAGHYSPRAYRETPYSDFTVRSYILIEGKNLSIIGEQGTILDGGTGLPTTALTIHHAEVTVRNLEIVNFRWDVEEDELYDGHGIFVIDGKARIDNVTVRNVQKMALTGRGASLLDVSNFRVLGGHVGIWLRETAYLRLTNSVVSGSFSGGLSAYADAVAQIADSVFEDDADDALYTENRASIYVSRSRLLRNKPFAAHALHDSNIWIDTSVLSDNEADFGVQDQGRARVIDHAL